MHKLDSDLSELANNLAFNHGGVAAIHLQTMLKEKAIPAFSKMLDQGPQLQALANSETFSTRVAHSQQGNDDLDTARAVGDESKLLVRFNRAEAYVQRQLHRLSASFDPSTSAIDNSLDTVYLLFQTILSAIRLLGQEYDHIQQQSVDIKELTAEIDQLLTSYQTIKIPEEIPQHLAQDRPLAEPADLLQAGEIAPVGYVATSKPQVKLTAADNPTVVGTTDTGETQAQQALAEFKRLVMRDDNHGIVNHDLELTSLQARDEVVRLYAATAYDYDTNFALFGRPLYRVATLAGGAINLHCTGEDYQVTLPNCFEFWFDEERVK